MCCGDCDGCCTYPHGPLSILATVCSVVAYVLAITASSGCFFVTVDIGTGRGFGEVEADADAILKGIGFGLFSYEDPVEFLKGNSGLQYCEYWDEDTLDIFADTIFKVARAVAIAANFSIGVGMIACIMMACMTFGRFCRKIVTMLLFLGFLCESLTFLIFASDKGCKDINCKFSIGAGLASGAAFMALISALIVAAIRDADGTSFIQGTPVSQASAPAGTVIVEEILEPDGTKKTIKTTTHPDGSKTIEETVEKPTAPKD